MSTINAIWQSLTGHPWLEVLGWTLLHFIWQALVVGIVVAAVLRLLSGRSAQARYLTGVAGLLVMAALPPVTGWWLLNTGDGEERAQAVPSMPGPSLKSALEIADVAGVGQQNPISPELRSFLEGSAARVDGERSNDNSNSQAMGWSERWRDQAERLSRQLALLLPWFVAGWCLGVVLLAGRLLFGLLRIRQWRAAAEDWCSPEIDLVVKRLVARIKPGLNFQVLRSRHVGVPAVMGFLKPVVLVPASMIASLTPTELEAILAHELAHIRRHDWLINLLQSMVETVLFYHPAVWWISRQVRLERENCCDDIAVSVSGNALVFAKALAKVEELRGCESELAVAASGGSLLKRIERVLGRPSSPAASGWPAGAMALMLICSLVVGIGVTGAQPTSAANSGLSEDPVVVKSLEQPKSPAAPVAAKPDDEPVVTRKAEQSLIDSKTGRPARIFSGIRLETVSADQTTRSAEVGLKYSNLFSYTFIPAKVARELEAVTLGEIDFGDQPPAPPENIQLDLLQSVSGSGQRQEEQLDITPQQSNFFVHDVSKPLEAWQKFVPYDDRPIWIPGHLGFYDMNQKQQHKFRVVRIDKVSLGIGPAFGPINALVLDDENSDFGVLGADWVQQVRGKLGEILVFSAADASFFLMQHPDGIKAAVPPPEKAVSEAGSMQVESSSPGRATERSDRDGVKVLMSHPYNLAKRQSTKYVQVQDRTWPVDLGISANGVWVGMTLMHDLVAIDERTAEVLWFVEWEKSHPFWSTISIVEIKDSVGQPALAIETFAGGSRNNSAEYRYRDLRTGVQFSTTDPLSPPQAEASKIPVTPVELDNGVWRRAVIAAQKDGRSAKELWARWQSQPGWVDRPGPISFTVRETVVSANPGRSIGNAVDAHEIVASLPEGSGLRAEFSGLKIEQQMSHRGPVIAVTQGKVEIVDAGGVVRAWASPDGGAEVLIAAYLEENGERILRLTARRLSPQAADDTPLVQCVVNPETGAPADEPQSPHGAVRYELPSDVSSPEFSFRMVWRYDVERIRQEAEGDQASKAAPDLPRLSLRVGRLQHVNGNYPVFVMNDKVNVRPDDVTEAINSWWSGLGLETDLAPQQVSVVIQVDREIPREWPMQIAEPLLKAGFAKLTFSLDSDAVSDSDAKRMLTLTEYQELIAQSAATEQDEGERESPDKGIDDPAGWGKLAFTSGLRSRLTLQTQQPQLGEPMLFKLEVKNFGEKPAVVDPQKYAAFRVMKAELVGKPGRLPFIGMTPQTSGQEVELKPGESLVLWEKVDLNELLLIDRVEPLEVLAEGGEWAMQSIWQDSNRIRIEPRSGELKPLQKLLAALIRAVPEGWTVSSGFGDIFLMHAPTNLKKDVTTIQLLFREAGAMNDLITKLGSEKTQVARLGTTDLGEALLLAPQRTDALWTDYQSAIERALREVKGQNAPSDQKSETGPKNVRQPWTVTGRVTDSAGQPLAGATVRAHCGIGSLRQAGEATSDESGNYVLNFGPGFFSENGEMVQAATISIRLAGYYETNLGRQGDLIAAYKKPEKIEWGDRTEEHLCLPEKPRQVDFVMAPAVPFSGRAVIAGSWEPAAGYQVSLTGKELPPSSSVLAQTTTDAQGKFKFVDVPQGFEFQLQIESAHREKRNRVHTSAPLKFLQSKYPEYMAVEYQFENQVLPFYFREMQLNLRGEGGNWREARAQGQSRQLVLGGDGAPSYEAGSNRLEYLLSELVTLELGGD